jgi:hypothetical protein
MGRKPSKEREEARNFVGSGELRDALERNGGRTLSQEAIQILIDACSFVLKV